MIFNNLHKTFTAAVFVAVTALFFSVPAFADDVVVTADNLNIRSGPTTDSESLTKAYTGDTFVFFGEP